MSVRRRGLHELRSQQWFAPDNIRSFSHRQRLQQMGLRREEFMTRPAIAVINTWSDLSPCHSHLRGRAEAVKRGILEAGGMPFELPAMSLGEVLVKPTTMVYRNLLSMEVEELLMSLPIDGAVLMGGCDKTTPGLLMGAISADIPSIFVSAGPMLNDRHRGRPVGAGTHTKLYWNEYAVGNIGKEEWIDLEARMTRSPGTCNTMGTASTMTSLAEVLGFALPGSTSIPAVDAAHERMCSASGARAVDLVWEDLKPSDIVSEPALSNAVKAHMALGGSTNAVVHLIALAGRAEISLTIDDIAALAGDVPVLANISPSGEHLMEDFYYAGGLPALLNELSESLDLECTSVTGRTLGDNIRDAVSLDRDVIRPYGDPVSARGALAVLRGNLAPDGAVIKPSAAAPDKLVHRGPALVFDSMADLTERIDDPDLEVDENTVLVLRNAGPVGAPGMPEWGNLPIPKKLLQQGVHDLVRVSDARMSGTHFGTCVLHVTPESAVGGPLALVRDGDPIALDTFEGTLTLDVSDAELAGRKRAWSPPAPQRRGYLRLYVDHVSQASEGGDFDFLEGRAVDNDPTIY